MRRLIPFTAGVAVGCTYCMGAMVWSALYRPEKLERFALAAAVARGRMAEARALR